MSQPTTSLYERMGGDAKIATMFQAFYGRVTSDPELAPFFADADMPKLINMQREFFSIALDGPVDYASRRLVGAHHGRGITLHHFSRFSDHLLATLLEHGLSQHEADRVLARIAIYAGNVTGNAGDEG